MQQLQKTTLTSLLAHYEPLVIAGLVFVAHLVLRAADRILVGAFNDDGAYVALGQALAGGVGYRLIYLVGDPVAVKYPPGLPLLIAVPWKLFGTLAGVRATIALLNPLASGAAAGIIWWIGRRRLDAAPAVLGLCALGPFFLDAVIQYFNIPLSEPYFVCGWATALLLTYRMADAGPGAARPALAATLGLVLALAALFRTAGVVLLAAVLVALVLERRPWREVALCAGVALVPLAVWHVVHAAAVARGPLSPLPDETPYWRWLPLDQPSQLLPYAARGLGNNGLGYLRYLSGYLAQSHFVGPTLAAARGASRARVGRSPARGEPLALVRAGGQQPLHLRRRAVGAGEHDVGGPDHDGRSGGRVPVHGAQDGRGRPRGARLRAVRVSGAGALPRHPHLGGQPHGHRAGDRGERARAGHPRRRERLPAGAATPGRGYGSAAGVLSRDP